MSNDHNDGRSEALSLLRDAEMIRTRKHSARKDKAMRALFDELRELDGKHGFKFVGAEEWNDVAVSVGGVHANVAYFTESGLSVTNGAKIVEVDLDYDSATDRMVGRTLDTFRAPTPGQAPQRRPAIAVLVDAILKATSR